MVLNDLTQNVEQAVRSDLGLLGERVRPQLEEAKRRLRTLDVQATAAIREHPAICLLGALGLGYLIARIARRQNS
jgi:hypothetical protein